MLGNNNQNNGKLFVMKVVTHDAEKKKLDHPTFEVREKNEENKWVITKNAPNPYKWSFRGSIYDFDKISHILPYVGDYLIELRIYDQFAGISVDFIRFTVQPTIASTVGFVRTTDKFSYQLDFDYNSFIIWSTITSDINY